MVRLMFMTFSGGDRSSAAEDTRISARAHPSYALTRQRGFAKMARPDKSRESRHHARAKRSEEHTSELQSRLHLVCRLLLEKKKSPSPGKTAGSTSVPFTTMTSSQP